MKPLVIIAAMLLVAGCHRSPEKAAIAANAAALQTALEAEADNMEALAGNAADANEAAAFENAADALDDARSNFAHAAHAARRAAR